MDELVMRKFAERYGLEIEKCEAGYRARGIGLTGRFVLGSDPGRALARLMVAVSTTPPLYPVDA